MYRLTVDIGVAFTSASYEMAEGSEVLRLSPYTVNLPSARFLADDGLRIDRLAETLRSIVETARQQLGEEPASVQVIYPASWQSGQLLQLWEALVLAGIPDAITQVAAEPKPSASPPSVDDVQLPAKTTLLPAKAAPRVRPGWLVAAAAAAVGAGWWLASLPPVLSGQARSRATLTRRRRQRHRQEHRTKHENRVWTFRLLSRSRRIDSWFHVAGMTPLSSTWQACPG